MICPACKADNRAGARFCHDCGTPLTPRCAACGAEHEPGQRFCSECGTPLAAGSVAKAAPASPLATVEATATGELRQVAVLFVDLVGYTSLSETRDAEDVRELSSRYFETARTIIGRYGGVVEKYIGDAVMAVWGTPVAHEDDSERAVRAALDLVDAVAAFGQEVGAPELQARGGVVTGQAAALANQGEGLVVGDRVNTASRAQSAADPGSVYVDDVTRRASSAAIAYVDGGEHTVKGKAQPLRLWRAVRVVAGVAGARREVGLAAPFVGRDGDLRLVKDLFHAGGDRGVARLVAVSGPAGVGKSRLLWEFEKYLDGLADTVLWHSGRCLSYGDGIAYSALAEMVRQRLALPEDASAEEASAKLAVGLERWVPDSAERAFLSPRLGALLGVAEPGLGRDDLFAGWRLFFERLAAHDPVILVFEDLQWADEGLLGFIEHLLDWSAQHRIFILCFSRPELAATHEGWPSGRRGATVLYLDPLDDGAMGKLLDALVTGLQPEARARIVEQSEGVPLYAIETVRGLVDRGAVVEEDGRLVLTGDVGELDVPASLTSLLAARLDALAPEERELAKAMSIFGGSFPRSAVVALGGMPEDRVDAILAALVRKEVFAIRSDPLSPEQGQYGFAQTMLRTVAYDMLSRRERMPRHLAAAEHLRESFPNDGEDMAEAIAAHLLDAHQAAEGDPDADSLRTRAVSALRRAAQRAGVIGAPERAERTYRTAAALAADEREGAELLEAAGGMAMTAGHYGAALELLETVERAHRDAGRDRAATRVAIGIGRSLVRLGRNQAAIERLQPALATLGPDAIDADAAGVNLELGASLAYVGRFDEAAVALERALTAAEALGLPGLISQAWTAQGRLAAWVGRFEQARILYEAAREMGDRDGGSHRASAYINVGDIYANRDLTGAPEHCQAALTLAQRLGDRSAESVAAGNLVASLIAVGRWDDAARIGDELLASSERRPDAQVLRAPLAILTALRGDTAAARRHTDALDAAPLGNPEDAANAAVASGLVELFEGQHDEAAGRLTRVCQDVGDGPPTEALRNAWPHAFEATLRLGRLDAAAALVDQLERQAPGRLPPFLRAHLAGARGLLAAARGADDEAEQDLRSAVDQFAALAYPYWRARAQTDLAGWLVAQGRSAEAEPLIDEAATTLQELRAAPELARALELRGDRSPAPR